MIPILYDKKETQFTSAGLASLQECIECTVEEDLDGMYELKMVYPASGKHFELLTDEMIIGATHDDNGDVQPFAIYKNSGEIDGKVTYNARHISYRLNTAVVLPRAAAVFSLADALDYIKDNSVATTYFTFDTDIPAAALPVLEAYIFQNAMRIRGLLLNASPMLAAFGGGETTFDKFNVFVQRRRGRDTGVQIRYRKNLKDINPERNSGETYNAVVPFWVGPTGFPFFISFGPKYVPCDSYDATTDILKAVPLDLTEDFETKPTDEQMRTAAGEKLEATLAWIANESIKVDFVALWQTEEYKDYAELQRVSLGDTVSVYYPELGVVANGQRVVKVVYDTLRERFTEITLNEIRETLWDTTESQISDTLSTEAKTLGVRTTKTGTVTTDANGVANINSLLITGGAPVSGSSSAGNVYLLFGSDGSGNYTAKVFDDSGSPIANTSIALTINSIR